jgi:type VII secretion protein EccB
MSSKKDLVEAHAFNRRRLATAFVSGAPGGREVEPVRLGRAVVGGLVLAVMTVAGAAVAGFLKPTLPEDWKDQTLVIGKENGSRFVALDGELYPVINSTSARLLLEDFKVTSVPVERIAEQSPGATIGIPGAPDVLPEPEQLVQTGWTACADIEGRTRLRIHEETGARGVTDALVVRTVDDTTYVVAGGYRYEVPEGSHDSVLRALGLDGREPWQVSGLWLDLFAQGEPLGAFTVPGSGDRVPAGLGAPDGVDTVGSVLRVNGQPYLLLRDGLKAMSEFAYTLYRSGGAGSRLPDEEASTGETSDMPEASEDPVPAEWPSWLPGEFGGDHACALLETEPDEDATVTLAEATTEAVVPADDGAARSVDVQPGHGAVVRTTGSGVEKVGTTYLVDASGTHYGVGDSTDLELLGYAEVTPVPVPLPWADLLTSGPVLDRNRAREAATETRASGGDS